MEQFLQEIGNNVILIASVATAVGVLVKIFSKPIRALADKIGNFVDEVESNFSNLNEKVDTIQTDVSEIKTKQQEHELNINALIIVNDKMPDEKRWRASKKYLEAKGNGGVEIAARQFMKEYEEQYEERLDRIH